MRVLAVATALALPIAANAAGGYTMGGHGTAGYRLVDIDGSKPKYREDYNLRSGLRLFDFDLDGQADTPDTAPLDRFHVGVETPGDEPSSRFTLTAVDRKKWDLRVDFTRSKYVYAVPQLWEAPAGGVVPLDDLHDWNTVRTRGAVDLTVHAPRLPTLLFGYRLYQREGDGISTMYVPGGDTFLVNAPADDVAHAGFLGTEFRALGTDVFLQQEYRSVDRDIVRDGPRNTAGLDPDDDGRLGSVRSVQDDHIDIPTTRLRLRRSVGERLDLRGAYLYSRAHLDFDASRRMGGVVSTVVPSPFVQSGDGDAAVSTHVADLGGTVDVTDRVRVVTDWRYHDRSQSGDLDETSTFGRLVTRTGNHVRRNAVTSEVEVEPRPTLTLSGGVGWHRRDANFSQSGVQRTTDAVGAVSGLRWRPSPLLSVSARYENVQVDDPFVVPGDRALAVPEREIALTFVNRATAGFQLAPRKWLALGYQLTADSRENDSFDARARAFGNTVSLTVEPRTNLFLFASYTRRDLEYRADILFPPDYLPTTSRQDGTEDVVVSEARWDFPLMGQAWSTGIDFAWVLAENSLRPRLEADGRSETFFDLQRADGGWFLTWHHRWVEPTIEVRRIEYTEPVLPANDYAATIVAFKLTRRFGTGR